MSRRAIALAVCLIIGSIAIPAASATDQALRYVDYSSSAHVQGSRATVDNPASNEWDVYQYDWFITSAYVDDGLNGNNLMQVGVEQEWQAGEGPSCNLGSPATSLYFFTEIEVNGAYSCWNVGTTTYSTSHLQSVKKVSGGYWWSFIDSAWTGVVNSWSSCGGYACTVAAFAEESRTGLGIWHAKFAGSGNTPWQLYNGTAWDTILSASTSSGSYWSGPTGPFPGGIWSFVYYNL